MFDIDLNTSLLLTSVDAAAEVKHWGKKQEAHLVPKVNRTLVFSAEMPCK